MNIPYSMVIQQCTKVIATNIESILKKTSAWSEAKKVGKSFVPSGDPTQAYERLIEELENVGLMIVEVGELESFVKSIGNHGPKWVNEVLYKDLANDPKLHDAREFVKKLIQQDHRYDMETKIFL